MLDLLISDLSLGHPPLGMHRVPGDLLVVQLLEWPLARPSIPPY
jgi:hypothetical protein